MGVAPLRLLVGLAVPCFVLALCLAWCSGAEAGSPLVIPAAAFLSDGIDPDGYEFSEGHIEGEGGEVHLVAPVYLPAGEVVLGLRAYVFDSTNSCDVGDEDVEVFLTRVALATGTSELVAITTSEGTSPNVEFTPTFLLYSSNATIDNNEYAYWADLKICAGAHHRFYALVVEY